MGNGESRLMPRVPTSTYMVLLFPFATAVALVDQLEELHKIKKLKKLYKVNSQQELTPPQRYSVVESNELFDPVVDFGNVFKVEFWEIDAPIPLELVEYFCVTRNHGVFIDKSNHVSIVNRDQERIYWDMEDSSEKRSIYINFSRGYENLMVWEENGSIKIDDLDSFHVFDIKNRRFAYSISWEDVRTRYTHPLMDCRDGPVFPIDESRVLVIWRQRNRLFAQIIDFTDPDMLKTELVFNTSTYIQMTYENGVLYLVDNLLTLHGISIKDTTDFTTSDALISSIPSKMTVFENWIILHNKSLDIFDKKSLKFRKSISSEIVTSSALECKKYGRFIKVYDKSSENNYIYDESMSLIKTFKYFIHKPLWMNDPKSLWLTRNDRIACIYENKLFYGFFEKAYPRYQLVITPDVYFDFVDPNQ